MSWNPNNKEIEIVSGLTGLQRYNYLIKKIVDQEVVWSLWNDGGWALAKDHEGQEVVPIWPHSTFAVACASDLWACYSPKEISLDVWIDYWLPGIQRDYRSVAAFPTSRDRGVIISSEEMLLDLKREMENYN